VWAAWGMIWRAADPAQWGARPVSKNGLRESRGLGAARVGAGGARVGRSQARLSLLIPIRPASSRAADRYQVRDGRVQRESLLV
jgi:hypothetical protein